MADLLRETRLKEEDFEGTLVLEKIAEIGRIDEFFDAIDADGEHQKVPLRPHQLDPRPKIVRPVLSPVVHVGGSYN